MVSPSAAPVYSKISAVFDQYREADVTPFGGHCFCGNVTVSVLYLYAGSGCSLRFSGWVSCGLYGSVVLLEYRFSTSVKYKDSELRDGPMWALVFRLVIQATSVFALA